MSEASTSYKKQDGKLSLSSDGRTVSWKPINASTSPLTILVSEITNLQQTPEKLAKVSIKIVVTKPSTSEVENHTFAFTSPNTARAEQIAITALLRKSIEAVRSQTGSTPAPPTDNGGGQPAAMAIAQAVSAGARAEDNTYEDARLMADAGLQKSLLDTDPALRQRFNQALREKPDTITISQFATQFWAPRVQLLRSHAVEKSQTRGAYNVLSVLKPQHVDGQTLLNISSEQLNLIFSQHPLVRKVYDENVPPLSETDFWSRFFASRLFKKIKGEKITENDSIDPKMDKYLGFEDEAERTRDFVIAHVPHIIDLEGNEQNHSQRQGNRPDFTMQPDKAPILRVLNRMSEKMMADVAPTDVDPHGPAGMDEETYQELQLRDLQRAAGDNRVMLKIRNQNNFFSAEQPSRDANNAPSYARLRPSEALSAVHSDLETIWMKNRSAGGLVLESAIGFEEDSSSEEEEGSKKRLRVGSSLARSAATSQIMAAIRQRHLHGDDLTSDADNAGEQAAKFGLSRTVFENLAMTHNTTVEFLHYFWTVFLSGDADRAIEAQKLVETLDRSLDRINAVAESAETERMQKVEKSKKQTEEYSQRTGKRRKFDPNSIKGGAMAVRDMMAPIIQAIQTATEQYRKAYEIQTAQITQLQNVL